MQEGKWEQGPARKKITWGVGSIVLVPITPTQALSNQQEEELNDWSGGREKKLKATEGGWGGQIVWGTFVFSSVLLAFIVTWSLWLSSLLMTARLQDERNQELQHALLNTNETKTVRWKSSSICGTKCPAWTARCCQSWPCSFVFIMKMSECHNAVGLDYTGRQEEEVIKLSLKRRRNYVIYMTFLSTQKMPLSQSSMHFIRSGWYHRCMNLLVLILSAWTVDRRVVAWFHYSLLFFSTPFSKFMEKAKTVVQSAAPGILQAPQHLNKFCNFYVFPRHTLLSCFLYTRWREI